ncbi:hypothetical protein Tco_1264441 [Tanacetum coccineum]
MHNNIMAAGSKDRPPMLGPGRYSQWRSRFLRYIDTKPNSEGLRKSILSGPYVPSTVLVQAVAATEGTRHEDTTPKVYQRQSVRAVLGIKDPMTVVGARCNCRSLGSATEWDTMLLTARDLANMQKEMQRSKAWLKNYSGHGLKRLMNREFRSTLQLLVKIQEVFPEESSSMNNNWNRNVTPDSLNICNNDNQVDQTAADCADERVALANLIANLTLDTEEKQNDFKAN